jgi:hypothetical protein
MEYKSELHSQRKQVKGEIISALEKELICPESRRQKMVAKGCCHDKDEACLHTVDMPFSLMSSDAQICGLDSKANNYPAQSNSRNRTVYA